MFFRKRKTVEQAQKHLQKGNLEKALKEYQRLLRDDPRDTSARLKVGDIHLRKGQVEDAIEAYAKVAEQFMHDGFDAKAVAIYKQIVKIDAKRFEVYVPLAELYQRLGLLSEALAAYQTAVDAAQRNGRHREALELLRKMATVDPANTTSRMKLAELLLQEELPGEAVAEYSAAAEELERQGEHEAALEVYGRVLQIEPERVPARLAAARAARALGRTEEALRHVAQAREQAPESVEALELNAEILASLDRPEELEAVHRQLAEVHRARGDEASAREILQRFVQPEPFEADAPSGPTPADEPEAVFEFGDVEPAPQAATNTPLALDGPAPVPPDAPAATTGPIAAGPPDQLLAEADVYVRYGKHERAVQCLEQVLSGEPEHRGALERLGEALEAGGRIEEAAAAWTRAATAARAAGDQTAFEALRARVGAAAFEDPSRGVELPPPPPAGEQEPPADEIDIDLDDLDELFTSTDAEPPSEAGEIAIDGEIRIEDELEIGDDAGVEDEIQIDAAGGIELEIDAGAAAAADTEPSLQGPSVAEEIEEAEFYLQQGLRDEARRVFERVLARAPEHAHARRQLEALAGTPTAVEPGVEAPTSTAGADPESPAREGFALPSDLFEEQASARVLEQELGSEDAPAERATPPAPAASEEAGFDLGAELAEELADEPSPEAPSSAPGRTEEEGFQALFSEFKRGVSKTLGEGDYETRYDLGIAYREMGLYEDAIGEFRIALESPARKGDALLMLGQCALDLGRPRDAVSHFEQALSLPDAGNEQSVNLRFQLGCAYEALGDAGRARAAYEAVLRDAPDFPEARERLTALGTAETELVAEAIDESAEPEESYESFDDVIAEAEAMFGRNEEADGEGDPERPAPEADAPASPTPRRRRRVTYS